MRKCFICDKKLGVNPARVITADDQLPFVGLGCLKDVIKAGEQGLETRSGPKVYTLPVWAKMHNVKFNFNQFPGNGQNR